MSSENEPVQSTTAESQAFEQQTPRRNPLLIAASWAIILLIVLGIGTLVAVGQFMMPRETRISSAELLSINMVAKSLVGFEMSEAALPQIENLKTGPIEQRLAHVFLVNEFVGAEQAELQLTLVEEAVEAEIKALADADSSIKFPSEPQQQLQQLTRQIIDDYAAGNFDNGLIDEEDRDLLEAELGWVGKLALLPKDTPDPDSRLAMLQEGKRVSRFLFLGGVLLLLSLAVGLFVLTGFIAMVSSKILRPEFQNHAEHGFVYIETFAIWLIIFMALQYVCAALALVTGQSTVVIMLSPFIFFGSLVALLWPLQRGISWSRMCQDIGLEFRNPFVEFCAGGISYVALTVPLAFGLASTAILGGVLNMAVPAGDFESTAPAGHPITEEISAGGPMMYVFIILSACVAAPIVEEIMFRGVLYRYLRDATGRKLPARWMSVLASAFVGGLIFATVHPQGIVAIPLLTLLAMGFAMVREWRNSLIGPMAMHAVHNSLVTCFLLLTLG